MLYMHSSMMLMPAMIVKEGRARLLSDSARKHVCEETRISAFLGRKSEKAAVIYIAFAWTCLVLVSLIRSIACISAILRGFLSRVFGLLNLLQSDDCFRNLRDCHRSLHPTSSSDT